MQRDKFEERWFLRIDEKVIGPATRDDLEKFLRPPRICHRMDVMCSMSPERWHRIQPTQTLDDVLILAGIVKSPQIPESRSTPRTSLIDQIRTQRDGLVSRVVEYRIFIAVGFLFVAINTMAWMLSRDPEVRERQILAQYELIWDKIRSYQEGLFPDPDWAHFAANSRAIVEPSISELKRTSNSHHPIRQNLLYAGQDQLLSLLQMSSPPTKDDPSSKIFEHYLDLLRHQLATDFKSPSNHHR